MAAKNIPQWHPTGLKINGLHPDFLNANKLGVFLSSLFIATFTFVIVSKPSVFGNYNTYAILLWSLYTVFWHTMYLTMVGAYIKPIHLPTVSNYFERIFLYARAHATLALFAVLCAAFSVNVYLTSRNPATPTAIAIAELSGRDIPENAVAIDRPRPSSLTYGESSVLSATDTLPRPGRYVYRVDQEDTLESVAANAVDDYADEKEYTLTLEQRSLAIEKLMTQISLHTILYSGDMLFIEPEYIEEAVQYGVEFTP